jgi:hypothetical protein
MNNIYLSPHDSQLAAYQRKVDMDDLRDTAIEVAEANLLIGSVSSLIAQAGMPYAGRITDLVRVIAENIVDRPDDDY